MNSWVQLYEWAEPFAQLRLGAFYSGMSRFASCPFFTSEPYRKGKESGGSKR